MHNQIIRVFPRRTAQTPKDDYVFVGDPPLIRPDTTEVHISCTFTWDISEAQRLFANWNQYYQTVKVGGPAFATPANGFIPGFYVKSGITFTSRGCNNQCPWCLVPEREGKLREIPIIPGNIVQDNNLLQCSHQHIAKVFEMLRPQHGIQFTGGLDSRQLTTNIADEIRSLRVKQIFLAADTKEALKPLGQAIKRLGLSKNKTRCYALLARNGESISDGIERLETIWELGAIPFAQLYQPPDKYIQYSKEWRNLARTWSRPAATKALHRQEIPQKGSPAV